MMNAPGLTNVEVRQLLQNSTVDLGAPGWDEETGYGRLDAWRAVTNAQGGDLGLGGDAGNAMATARPLSTSQCALGCGAFLNDSYDQQDWYAFTIDDPYNSYNWLVDVDVAPEGDDDVRLELRNAAGTKVAESDQGGVGAAEAILYEVTPSRYGDYYLLVFMKAGPGDWEGGWGRYDIAFTTYVIGLKGYVTDQAGGGAVANAKVRVSNADRTYTTTASSGGYYEVTVYPGAYTAEAWRCDFKKGSVSVSLWGGWTTQDFALQKKATGTLYGYVTDGFGKAVGGATVRENCDFVTTTTDTNGYYSFTVYADGPTSVSAYKTGYQSQTQTVSVPAGGSKRLDFTLECSFICIQGGDPVLLAETGPKPLSSGPANGEARAATAAGRDGT
jgi:hypothetical protein